MNFLNRIITHNSNKILPLVGINAEERKQNQLFPANRILVPTRYCDRTVSSAACGRDGGSNYYYEQDPSQMATEDLRTVKALTIKDPEDNNDDCDDME